MTYRHFFQSNIFSTQKTVHEKHKILFRGFTVISSNWQAIKWKVFNSFPSAWLTFWLTQCLGRLAAVSRSDKPNESDSSFDTKKKLPPVRLIPSPDSSVTLHLYPRLSQRLIFNKNCDVPISLTEQTVWLICRFFIFLLLFDLITSNYLAQRTKVSGVHP